MLHLFLLSLFLLDPLTPQVLSDAEFRAIIRKRAQRGIPEFQDQLGDLYRPPRYSIYGPCPFHRKSYSPAARYSHFPRIVSSRRL